MERRTPAYSTALSIASHSKDWMLKACGCVENSHCVTKGDQDEVLRVNFDECSDTLCFDFNATYN